MTHTFFSKTYSILLGLSVLFVGGCAEDSSSATGEKKPQIVMGTSADMPPFEFYNASKIVGYDIDIARAVTQELGLDLKVRDMDFSALVPSLQSGRVAFAMASMTPTPEREKAIGFSIPYLTLPLAILALGPQTFHSKKDLSGKIIGVQLGSTHEQFAREVARHDPTIQVHPLNKLTELVQELISGRVDVVVMETKTAHSFQGINDALSISVLKGQTVSFAIAFPKESPWRDKFNSVIAKLHASGRFDAIRAKWFSDSQSKLKG